MAVATRVPLDIGAIHFIGIGGIGMSGIAENGWSARAQVKNINNQHYSPFVGYGSVAGVVRFVPRDNDRYYGLTLRKDF